MNGSKLRVRRATIEDLGTLRPLWESMHFSIADLEKRLTEFQVVENTEGNVLGGIGFQNFQHQARIHSEAYTDFAVADTARTLLWERLKTLSSNHGVFRLWTRENAPFWRQTGFHAADAETMQKLPADWNTEGPAWSTLPLKDESAMISIEKELALFMQSEKQRTARAFQHARMLKTFATVLAIIFAMFVLCAIIFLLRKNPNALTPGR